MARRHFNDGQEVVLEDLNAIPKALERHLYERVVYEMLQRTEDAFFGDGLLVSYASASSVTVKRGLGFQFDNTQTSPETKRRPVVLDSDANLNLSSPDATNDRIDIVVVNAALFDEISATRKFKDAISDVISNQNLVVQKDWRATLQIVDGTPDVSPSAPATPSGTIKIAELYVNAVSGLSGAGDVTDTRTLFPLGGGISIDTLGYDRLTASAGTPLDTLFAEIDAYLKNGDFEYYDIEELVSDPAAPAAGKQRVYLKDSILYRRESGGAIVPIGSGGGGGGGLTWTAPNGSAPILEEEFERDVFMFSEADAGDQKLTVDFKVPNGYIPGRQLLMDVVIYSPSAADTILLSASAALVRKNNDAMDSPAGTHNSTNTALTNTVANQGRLATIDLTNSVGTVAGFAVSPGDVLKIELVRGTDTDSADIRFVPTSTEIRSA